MPLVDQEFDKKFLTVTPDLTVGQALDALHARGGADDWFLFVHWSKDEWGALRVSQLKEYLGQRGPALFGMTFAQIKAQVPAATVAQQDEIGIGLAEQWALADPQGVMGILRGEEMVGRFYRGTNRERDPYPQMTMSELYGGYLDSAPERRAEWWPKELEPHAADKDVGTGGRHAKPPPGPPPPRKDVVSTGFAPQSAPAKSLTRTTPLAWAGQYYFWLKIGAPDRFSIETRPTGVDVKEFPPGAQLKVALFAFKDEIEITSGADVGVLKLLKDGSVEVERQPQPVAGLEAGAKLLKEKLFFPVRAPAREGTFHLRCNIYYGQVLIQSRLIHARVMREPRPVRAALRAQLDYKLARSPNSTHVARVAAHRLSIMLNRSGDGTHDFRYFGAHDEELFKREVSLDEHLVQSLIDDARGALRRACWGDTAPWTDPAKQKYRYDGDGGLPDLKKLQPDLVNMAIQGYRMVDTFTRELVGALPQVKQLRELMRTPGAVQIALKMPARFVLPAALFYDYPLDTNLATYSLCPAFVTALGQAAALEDQACFQGNCPSRGKLDVVCPSGFWGFRHRLGLPISEATGSDVACEIATAGAVDLTVCVSTDPALEERAAHVQAVHALRPDLGWTYADSRDGTFEALKEEATVVYFYCHGGLAGDLPYLQVGPTNERGITPDNLSSSEIYWPDPRPLVFINGCHTTAVEPEVALDFVDAFVRTSHAAGVIGTEITVFEPLARPFAEGFLRRFVDGLPLGEAVRATRLALLKAGNPLGLAYIPYALAGLHLAPQAAAPGG